MPELLRRHGPKVAVGGLAVLNVVLIGALVLKEPGQTAVPTAPAPTVQTSPRVTPAVSSPSSSTSAGSAAGRSDSPSPSARTSGKSASPSAPSDHNQRPRLLAASTDQIAWRSEPNDCRTKSKVEVSSDGGRTWTRTDPGLRSVVRLKAYRTEAVFAVGADADCRPSYAWTTGPDQPWQRSRSLVGDKWFRMPARPEVVHAPGGGTSRPCGSILLDLAGLGTYQAAALCGDGRIRTVAEGRSWRTVQKKSGAVALNADDVEFVVASALRDCDGTAVRRFDGTGAGLKAKPSACRAGSSPRPGLIAVSYRYGHTWVWAGQKVTVG